MAGEDFWRERAESAEAKVTTAEQATTQIKEKYRFLTETFGIKESMSGDIRIDYDKLVEELGIEDALALRRIIDERYGISGNPGDKPKVRVSAG